MTTTTTPPHLALARRRETAWRQARSYTEWVECLVAACMLGREMIEIAEADEAERYSELVAAIESAGVGSPGQAREAGLSVWVDAVLGIGIEVEEGGDGR